MGLRLVTLGVLASIVVLGAVVVDRFQVWAYIDERAHYSFVQTLAEDGRLPELDELASPETQAITDRTWPDPSPTDPATLGLGGRSYEAFQPPLYYALAVPAYGIVGDHRDKVFVLRVFDLLLYLAGVAVLWLLARRLAPSGRAAWLAWLAGLLVLAWPGLLVRGITVSNTALEFALVPAFLLAAWNAYDLGSARWLLGAGVLLGLCVMTKLTLAVLAPCLLLAAVRLGRPRVALGALAAPAVIAAPWLLFRYDLNAAAREQQTPVLYPDGVPDWGIGDLPAKLAALTEGSLPQEWYGQLDVWWVGILARGLVVALVIVALLAAGRRVGFFALPVLAALALMTYTLLFEQWDVFLLRYAAPLLAPLAIAAAAHTRRAAWVCGAAAVATGLLWVDVLGAYLFTDVGDRLGI